MKRRAFLRGLGAAIGLAVSSPSLAWTQARASRALAGFRAGEVHEVTFSTRWLDIPVADREPEPFDFPASYGAFTIENPFGCRATASVFWPDEGGSPELVSIEPA